jgi:hypothetical protein
MEQESHCVLVSELRKLEEYLFAKADSTIAEIYASEYYDLSNCVIHSLRPGVLQSFTTQVKTQTDVFRERSAEVLGLERKK